MWRWSHFTRGQQKTKTRFGRTYLLNRTAAYVYSSYTHKSASSLGSTRASKTIAQKNITLGKYQLFILVCFTSHILQRQVMATNLLSLGGGQSTVAVVGLAHVDGIETILAANGWKPKRC